MNTVTRAILASTAMAAVVALSGCTINHPGKHPMGGGSSAQRPDDVNQDDVMFVTMMIPHHEQAVEMSDILLEKPGIDSEVSDLAEDIKAAQKPEVEQMEGWLSEWGVKMGRGMDHGDGMMSEHDLDALESAEGESAEAAYLELMIAHHEGAIEMADDVLSDGENPDVRELAETIIDTQAEEIALMEDLLEGY